jgi:hypothetical protein
LVRWIYESNASEKQSAIDEQEWDKAKFSGKLRGFLSAERRNALCLCASLAAMPQNGRGLVIVD